MKYAQDIADATQEIFSSMLMLDVDPGDPFLRDDSKLLNGISGIIGLAGEVKGLLAIHLPNKAAQDITTAFLGMDVEEINEDVCDAVGELANMLGGCIKTILDPGGSNVQISMPSAIYGEEYAVDCLTDSESVTVPFTFNAQTFMVELQISQKS
ncbi:chemotaxis protein CheX [uncultured Desulfuromusa sp.]|uniref:chemotaxis protein CheX n=1 Tax=uncultured Desulfuromusa sp. TaxID=219183 RepID=UPI002AA87DD1|nr:chemotaxis protein CheX [uncultured Desulfuromusa sp.]